MKTNLYSSRPRLVVWQEPDLLSEKKNNLLEPPIQTRFITFL